MKAVPFARLRKAIDVRDDPHVLNPADLHFLPQPRGVETDRAGERPGSSWLDGMP